MVWHPLEEGNEVRGYCCCSSSDGKNKIKLGLIASS